MMHRRSFVSLLASIPLLTGVRAFAAAGMQPMIRRVAAAPGREVEISNWTATAKRIGTIAFSHGFGSSPRFYPDFVQAWTAAGYDVIAPLHTDSREHPQAGKLMPATNWAERMQDMRAVAGLIEGRYIAAGHSFGALTALVLGGVNAVVPQGIKGPLADKRVRAVIAFSPPGPAPTLIPEEGFATLARPALIQTGTRDLPPPGTDPEAWRTHLTAFARAPVTGDHHGLVLEGVDHYFGGLICDPSKQGPDQRALLRLATGASLAFLSRYNGLATLPKSTSPAFPIDPAARYYVR
jgi:dienelactone hydrolase